jgi:hypothetical protein
MNRKIVDFLLRITVAFYFFVNGIMIIRKSEYSEFVRFVEFIFGKSDNANTAFNVIVICLFAGSIWLILPLLKIEKPIFDRILLYQSFGLIPYIIGYVIYTVLNKVDIFICLREVAILLMAIGIMFASVKKNIIFQIKKVKKGIQ